MAVATQKEQPPLSAGMLEAGFSPGVWVRQITVHKVATSKLDTNGEPVLKKSTVCFVCKIPVVDGVLACKCFAHAPCGRYYMDYKEAASPCKDQRHCVQCCKCLICLKC